MIERCPGMLASVKSLIEAQIAFEEGADVIDLKDPSRGALGGLDHGIVSDVVRFINGRTLTSATIGDLVEMQPQQVSSAVECMAKTNVDLVKVGFFPSPSVGACIDALHAQAREGIRIVAVLFADQR